MIHFRLTLSRVLRYDLDDEYSVEKAFLCYGLIALALAFPLVIILIVLGGK